MFCTTQQCSNRWSFIFKTQQRNGGYATDFSAEHCLDKFSLQQRGSHNSHNRIFDVPDNQSPQASILNLANERWNMKDKKATAAALHDCRVCPFHATTTQACIFCCKTLSAKKTLHLSLNDDVLSTRKVVFLTKYCGSCKITCYPGFSKHYTTKMAYFCRRTVLLSPLIYWIDKCA